MKRQADGIRLSGDIEEAEENDNKRIKLVNNDINKENIQEDHAKEKSVMDACENSHDLNYEDQSASTSNNVSPKKFNDVPEKVYCSNESVDDIGSDYNTSNRFNNHNGSCDEAVVEVTTTDSSFVSESHYTHSFENSVQPSVDNYVCNDREIESPIYGDHDHHQNENSSDSFKSDQSDQNTINNSENDFVENHINTSSCEVLEKHTSESNYEILEEHRDELNNETTKNPKADVNSEILQNHASQKQDSSFDKEFSFEPDVKKIIDIDNLTLSHLKVIELLGHTEEVFSVTADDDFILSSSADTTTKVWNMERQNTISTFSGHSDTVTSVLLLNPDQSKKIKKKMSLTKVSRIAITGSLDCHIKLWSVLEGKELASVYTFNGITCLGYLESDCLVVVGTEGGKLELWNLSSKKAVVSERAHEDAVTDIKVIGNNIYSISVDGAIKVWCYEDEDLFPVYSRKRKEVSSDNSGFKPAQWKTVAVADNIMYLGDSSNSIKMLDWRAGRLSLFRNQLQFQGVCHSLVIEENMLFSSSYDSYGKRSSINMWKLPEMTYVATLSGGFPKINNFSVVQKDNKLRIITGGDKLFLCEFDFSKAPGAEGEFFVCECDVLGEEINENPVELKKEGINKSSTVTSEEKHSSSNKWCNVM